MQNQKQTKLFAFKLADQREQQAQPAQQWKARDGVATAACTYVDVENLMLRASDRYVGSDGGIYC